MGIWKPILDGTGDTEESWVGHDASERFPVYTRGNAGEVYPEVFTPLSFSVAAEAGEKAMRNAILTSGLVRPKELEGIPISTAIGSGVFGGYAYLNLSIQRLAAARTPGGKATDADVNYLGVGDPPPHEPLPGERNLVATLAGLRYLWRTVRTDDLPELADDQRLVDEYLGMLSDPETSTDAELRSSIDELMPLFADLFERHLIVSFAAGMTVAVLTGLCDRQLDDPTLAVRLLAGLGDVDSAAPSRAIWELSRLAQATPAVAAAFDAGGHGLWERLQADPEAASFVDRFQVFLEQYGSRGPNEWDTAFDTWETDPALALTMVDRMFAADDSHDPVRQHRRLAEDAAEAEAKALAELPRLARWPFRKILAAARLYSRSRERTKTTVIRAIHGARLRAMELDRRLVERSGGQRGDLWFVLDGEMDDYVADPGSFASVIEGRRAQRRRLAEREPPFFFSGSQPPLSRWKLRTETREPLPVGELLTGLPGCPGIARGRARIVTEAADPRGLQPGDVLIAPLTDPAWTPLFVPVEAVVVDVGAIMSHAVIVSRELGIPCVVSATDATKRIADGALVEVDGTAGTVRVIEA
ncbi:MAG: PEP-utilizing enzyme [Acidimicrobiia bacterium]|nr:PEP-utilizing enzyme [Acidimicrobiia bacterium]